MMNQKGRSMIEMLGVLAIIGVLSVGGIAGYSKAMFKYRMNQTIQTVTQALQRLIELSDKNWGEQYINNPSKNVKYGLLPTAMCPADYVNVNGDTEFSCKLPLGEIAIGVTRYNNKPYGEFMITFFEGNIVQSCVDFLSYHWEKLYPQEWLIDDGDDSSGGSGIGVEIEGDGSMLWATKTDRLGGKSDNITLNNIQNACNTCKEKSTCTIYMFFNSMILF